MNAGIIGGIIGGPIGGIIAPMGGSPIGGNGPRPAGICLIYGIIPIAPKGIGPIGAGPAGILGIAIIGPWFTPIFRLDGLACFLPTPSGNSLAEPEKYLLLLTRLTAGLY